MSEEQLRLFGAAPPRQPRCRSKERMVLYETILALRARGHRVYRSGRATHTVDGRYVHSLKQLSQILEQDAKA